MGLFDWIKTKDKCSNSGNSVDYPIPTHLKEYLTLIGEENSEYEIAGSIHCSCGCEQFEVWESNECRSVKLKCMQCGKEIVVFDSGKHGWNGFVCKDDFLDRTLPFNKYNCPECNQNSFRVAVFISSQGKQDFLDECVSNDDSFSPDDWVDGFDWIRISLQCVQCSFKDKEWASLETM